MKTANMHVGPTGATGDGNSISEAFLETGVEFQPKDLETFIADRTQVLEISPEQGPNFLNGMKQVPVGIHNADKGSSGTNFPGSAY